ncbi:MAG: acyl-CoA dehydrogenase N-terminal domain-containing protein, partial [Marinosulfonomonas sp.]|nr:acyl-CoA dehydrogenase N-terminal domain-containing protein [Marinosulfonomonas sp.]
MPYRAPARDYQFLFDHVVGLDQVSGTDLFAEATPDMVEAILIEAGRVSNEILAPLQREGDLHPAVLENGKVRCSPGFDAGYRAIADGGWIGISASVESGGMGLPVAVTIAVNEMMAG